MTYGYIRVSTDKQDSTNQKIGIESKARALGLCIDKYISDDGVSGTRDPKDRALGGCLKKLKDGDVIICSEISRLGRRLFMIMNILEYCMRCGARVYTVKDNYELGDNIQSKVLAFAFGLSAEIERDLISQRTREALARLKSAGKKLGRRTGSRNKTHKLSDKTEIINHMLACGMAKTRIAKRMHVSPPTLYKFIAENKYKTNVKKI